MDMKPILSVIGTLLLILAGTMLVPLAMDFYYGERLLEFGISAIVTAFFGVTLILATRGGSNALSIRQAFLLTNMVWIAVASFGALPFVFADQGIRPVDAIFESMSGITTTGSTVLTGLNGLTHGLLLWRAILQWLGGVGIVVMALSILPLLQVGGMQMFKAEGFEQSEKALPRAGEIAANVIQVYVLMTIMGYIAYDFAGMSAFDAVVHAMTAISTGGMSTQDASLGHWNNPLIHWISVCLMVLGSLPFMLYIGVVRGGLAQFHFDSQARAFLLLLGILIAFMTIWLIASGVETHASTALRLAAFNVTSTMTGTGFATADYSAWGALPNSFFFVIMFFGGCAGSTTCGIKIFRLQVLFAASRLQLRQLLEPRGVFVASYDGRRINIELLQSVTGFFFLFIASFGVLAVALSLTGLEFMTAISAAATAICNVGPGLGPEVGPAGSFANINDSAKWIMTFGMFIGRLEIYSVLIMLMPTFWRP